MTPTKLGTRSKWKAKKKQKNYTAVNRVAHCKRYTYPVTHVTMHVLCMKEHNPAASSDQRLQFLFDVLNLPAGQCWTVIQLWLTVVQNNGCYVFESEIHSVNLFNCLDIKTCFNFHCATVTFRIFACFANTLTINARYLKQWNYD